MKNKDYDLSEESEFMSYITNKNILIVRFKYIH